MKKNTAIPYYYFRDIEFFKKSFPRAGLYWKSWFRANYYGIYKKGKKFETIRTGVQDIGEMIDYRGEVQIQIKRKIKVKDCRNKVCEFLNPSTEVFE